MHVDPERASKTPLGGTIVPVRAESSIRLWKLLSEQDKEEGRLLTDEVIMEMQGGDKPALMAEWLLYVLH